MRPPPPLLPAFAWWCPAALALSLLISCAAPRNGASTGTNGTQPAQAEAMGRGPTRLDGEWQIGRLSSGLLPPGQPALTFERGAVRGSIGCNTLRGRYMLNGLSLTFSQLSATRQTCPPAVAAAERLILKSLRGAVSYYPMNPGGQETLRLTGGGTLYLLRP